MSPLSMIFFFSPSILIFIDYLRAERPICVTNKRENYDSTCRRCKWQLPPQ